MKQSGFILPFPALYLYIGASVAVLALLGFLRFHWIHEGREQALRESVEAAAKIVKQQGEITERVVTEYVEVQGKTRTVERQVEKEVIRYVETHAGSCLDADWGRLHDSAAAGAVPDPAPRVDGERRAPEASAALETVTANYAACHRTADRLDALQTWVKAQNQ